MNWIIAPKSIAILHSTDNEAWMDTVPWGPIGRFDN